MALSLLGFVLAGLGLLGVAGLNAFWPVLAIAAALASLVLLVLFWNSWLVIGLLIDLGIIIWAAGQL